MSDDVVITGDAHPAPDSPILADAAAAWRSAYVHIPFCRRRCPYCDFAIVTPEEGATADTVSRYGAALLAEIAMERDFGSLDAINFGGGTPSTLDAGDVAAVLARLDRRFGIAPGAEVSLEANPEDWTPELAAALFEVGITRVSLGIQSFGAGTLEALGRMHTAAQAIAAIETARAAEGISVGIDLIFGSADETLDAWAVTVETALKAEPDHISVYALTVELGTALSRAVRSGVEPAPDPDLQADAYELFSREAAQAGFVQYEVSNFARPGHHVRYNLSTWAQGDYVAFGLGAHGHRGGVRRRNVRRLAAYLRMVEAGDRPEAGVETIEGWASEQERLMLGLRRTAGVETGEIGRRLWESAHGVRLRNAGAIAMKSDRIVVERPLLTDEVARGVLSLSPGDC
jgi:oxygen-independent coproporphyrinogen-3 oxidase